MVYFATGRSSAAGAVFGRAHPLWRAQPGAAGRGEEQQRQLHLQRLQPRGQRHLQRAPAQSQV